MKTPKTPKPKRVQDHKRVNNLVNRSCARDLFDLLTGKSLSTDQFFTELLAIAGVHEQMIASAVRRHALKSAVAAVWECVRYGWRQGAFGRVADPKATLGEIKCRRTRVLMKRAVKTGAEIAHRQATCGV